MLHGMKLFSLSVKRLLRAISASLMLATTLCSGSFASAAEVWASGVSAGGGWTDYNKSLAPGDDYLCWAAASSNVINHWQNRYWIDASIPTGEDIWTQFKNSVSYDAGGSFSPAFQWWLTGDYEGAVDGRYYFWAGDVIKTDIEKFAGYYFDSCDLSTDWYVNPDNYDRLSNSFWGVSYSTSGGSHMATRIVSQLKTGAAICLSLADEGGLAHAITLWGVEYEEVGGKVNVTKLWVVDSDDNQYGVNKQGLFAVDVTTDEYGNIVFDSYWGNVTGSVYIDSAASINLAETDTWLYRLWKVSTAGDITDGSLYDGGGAYALQNSITVSGASADIMPSGSASRIYTSADVSKPSSLEFNGATHRLFAVATGEYLKMQNLENLQFISNAASGNGVIVGSTGSEIVLIDNQSVVFRGNKDGGAINAHHLSIRNNGSVLFEKNITNDADGVLRSITANGNVELSAASGKSIEFRDTIYLSSSASLSLNATYTGTDGESVAQVGDILFTGKYTEAALKEMSGKSVISAEELAASRTSEILTTTSLQGGRLRVEAGAVVRGRGLTVESGSKATVLLENGTLDHTGYAMTFSSGSTLELSGCNTMGGNLDMQAGSTLKISLTGEHSTKAALTYTDGSISLSESGVGLKLLLDEDAEYGSTYKLIEGVSNKYSSLRWTLNLGEQPTYFDWDNCLTWNDDSLVFLYDVMDPVWNNASGNKLWDAYSVNWDENGQNSVYRDNSMVQFGDAGAGEVTLVGTLKPYSVTVENSVGKDYTWSGNGKLSGSMQLTKKGAGVLTIKCGNEYTGGTVVEAGALTVGHAEALGTGKVSLKGGTLDLGDKAVANSIEVDGAVVLNGAEAYQGGLSLVSGELSGGMINLRQKLELREGSISNDLQGTGSIVKLGTGKAILSGKNTGTGTVTITEGTLEVAGPDSLGVGNVELNGGILSTPAGVTLSGQTLSLNGGDISGSLTLGEYATLDVLESATVNGSLTLQSGTVKMHGELLTVTETLVIDGNTKLDVSCWLEYGTYRVMRVGSVSGNLEDLELYTTGRNTNRVSKSGSFILLTVSAAPTTLYWTEDEGVWANRGDVEWAGSPGETLADARFHAKDDVVFAQGGEVTIEGEVAPNSVVVSGADALILKGEGSITGKASLRKDGSGSLRMNAANSYIGGTTINDGLVTAGGAESFGSGSIILNGGVLDLQDYAVKNDIQAYGGALAASAYEGNLVVSGDLQIAPELRAKNIRLNCGRISGMAARARVAVGASSIIDTPIEAFEGSIDVDMQGTTSLKVSLGSVEVTGLNNSYSGGTVLESGTLTVAEGSSLGTGDISLMGGLLKASGGISLGDSQKLSMQGGRFEGGLSTTPGSELSAVSGSTLTGSLTLGGGWVHVDYQMGSVSIPGVAIDGTLSITGKTAISLTGYYTQDSVVFSFENMSGSVENLVLVDEEGNVDEKMQLSREDNSIVVSLSETVKPGEPSWNYNAAELNDMLAQSTWGTFHASHAFTDAIRGEKFSGAPVGYGVSFWVSGIQSFATVDASGVNKGADATHTGGAIGLEMLAGERSCIGLAAGLLYGEVQTDGNQTEMDQDSTHVALYGATRLYSNEKMSLTLSAYAAYGTYESSPTAQYATDMTWKQDAVQLNARLDCVTSVSDTLFVNLFGGLDYFAASEDEVNGISSGELVNLRAELGVGVTKLVGSAGFHAEACFLGDIVRDNPTPMVDGVRGDAANPGRVGFGLSAGASYNITPEWSVNVNANAEFMDGASSCNVNAGTVIRF